MYYLVRSEDVVRNEDVVRSKEMLTFISMHFTTAGREELFRSEAYRTLLTSPHLLIYYLPVTLCPSIHLTKQSMLCSIS